MEPNFHPKRTSTTHRCLLLNVKLAPTGTMATTMWDYRTTSFSASGRRPTSDHQDGDIAVHNLVSSAKSSSESWRSWSRRHKWRNGKMIRRRVDLLGLHLKNTFTIFLLSMLELHHQNTSVTHLKVHRQPCSCASRRHQLYLCNHGFFLGLDSIILVLSMNFHQFSFYSFALVWRLARDTWPSHGQPTHNGNIS